jgi:WD40 repeat protein
MSDPDRSEAVPERSSAHDSCRSAASGLLDEQRASWERGECKPVEVYLEEHPELHTNPEAVVDLIYQEVLLRQQRGEGAELDEYRRRFPHYEAQLRQQFELHELVAGANKRTSRVSGTIPPPTAVGDHRPMVGGPPGPSVPGCEILRELGRGGMGVVYLARQISLKRYVVIKVIREGGFARPGEVARFRTEAEAIARLQHPQIVQIHEVGEHESGPYLVLEWMEGGSLDQKLAGAPQPPDRAARLVESLARAIHYAHQRGIVHRDLKPANVLLSAEGTPKISDFGLAKLLERGPGGSASQVPVGTPCYMPPEQARAEPDQVGPAADTYALGAVLYELITGRPPFLGATVADTLLRVLAEDPVPPQRLRPEVPRDLETICLKCLEKKPDRRYSSAEALADDLARFLAGKPITARPIGPWERATKWIRRQPALAAALALVVLVTVLGFGLVTRQWRLAVEARDRTESARHAEERARRQYQGLSINLTLERGASSCEREDVARGMLWFARALELGTGQDADLERVLRTNLADWGRELCPLKALLDNRSTVTAAASGAGHLTVTGCADGTARLWNTATGKLLTDLPPHRAAITAVAISPDGKKVLTCSADRTARLWEVPSAKPEGFVALNRPIGEPLRHDDRIQVAAFSPDGSVVVTGSYDTTARFWEAATGKPVGPPVRHEDRISFVAFSRDGTKVLTASRAGVVRLWEVPSAKPEGFVATGKQLGKTIEHGSSIVTAVFSPDGKAVLTAGKLHHRQWSAATGAELGQPVAHHHNITTAAYSPDGKTIWTGDGDNTVRLWNAASGTPHKDYLRHHGELEAIVFSPDGSVAATGGRDQTARFWDVETRQPIGAPLPHPSGVRALAFSSDGKTLLTRGDDRVARLWLVPARRVFCSGVRHETGIVAVAFSREGFGTLIVTGDRAGTARIWEAATGKLIGWPLVHPGGILTVAFSPDGKTIATAGGSEARGEARLWEVATGKPIGAPLAHLGPVRAVAFSPDSKTILTGSDDRTARLWDTTTGLPRVSEPLVQGGAVRAVAFSPDGKTVLTGGYNHVAKLWNAATGRPLVELRWHQSAVNAVAFSPDGTVILTASDDGTARLWEAATGAPRHDPLVHQGKIRRGVFSPDGKFVLTGSDDRTARLWDTATGQQLGSPLEHQSLVLDVAFGPDGKTVLTASRDHKTHLWEVPSTRPEEFTATGRPLGRPIGGAGTLAAAAFSPDGRFVLTAHAKRAELHPVQKPLTGETERIVLWVQVATGLELDENGAVRVLGVEKWQQRQRRLEQLGGPPPME